MLKSLFTASVLATSMLAYGQTARPLIGKDTAVPSSRFPAEWYPKENGMSTSAPIADAPFSATETITIESLDSEGKSVSVLRQKILKWRDSAGRLREEEFPSEVEGHPTLITNIPHQITAVDTVQHCEFHWANPAYQERDRQAVVSCNSLEMSRTEESLASKMRDPEPQVIREQFGSMTTTTVSTPLGKRTLQGLEVMGVRSVITQVDAQGKPQDSKESEIWWSPALHQSLLMSARTRQNIITLETSGIERNEPDPKLFYPPEGYPIQKRSEMTSFPLPPQP